MINEIITHYNEFLLVFIRMNGMILFNPLLGRRNIPAMVKVGLAFLLSGLFIGVSSDDEVPIYGLPSLVLMGISELLIGFGLGTAMNLFFSAVLTGAEMIDTQLGLGMARFYDPASNVSMPITGSLLNTALILLFFASKGHLTLIRLIAQSFQLLPVGFNWSWDQAAISLAGMFMSTLTLALQLALPVIAAEMLLEICLGVMTRAVPQINVFTVGVQIKVFVGVLVLIIIAPALGSYFDSLYGMMFKGMEQILYSLTKA